MENERNNKVVSAQWLHMLNSSHIERKIEQGSKLKAIIDSGKPPREIITQLYLTILSRFPTAEEMRAAEEYGQAVTAKGGRQGAGKRRDDWVDITWALINSSEFLYRH
jgi:hypothetical protein